MKKLLFTLFCLFAIFTAKAQCDYTISGADTYGDGWNGGFVTISVDNVETIFTVPSTADANEVVTLSIPTYTDDPVTFTWTAGSYADEVRFGVSSPDGTQLYSFGPPPPNGTTFVTDTSVSTCAPPSCTNPSASISNITASGATASWAAATGAASYDWEVVPSGGAQGTEVVASGSGETGLTVSITGLTSGTGYDFLISSDCTTDYASAVSFTTLPGCGDTVVVCYDNGLNKLSELESSGDYITVTFNEGDVESCCDEIFVYDTLDQTGNLLFTGTGDLTGVTATSTTGEISVWMDADVSYSCTDGQGGPYTQISMTYTCAAPPSCPNPSNLTVSNLTATAADLAWGGTGASWDIELVDLSTGDYFDIPGLLTNFYQATNLVSGNDYEVYIRTNCGTGEISDWAFTSFTTLVVGDLCSDALPIVCGDLLAGDTSNATSETLGVGNYSGANEAAKSLWYTFVGVNTDNPFAPNGRAGDAIQLSTCNDSGATPGNALYDTKIDFYSGADCGTLTYLGGNDDGGGCGDFTSLFNANTIVGTVYYVRVYGYNAGASGAFNLSMTCESPCIPSAENDSCDTLESVANNTSTTGDNTCQTNALANPSCDAFGSIADLWYEYTTPAGANGTGITITFDDGVTNTATNVNYALYEGCGTPLFNCFTSEVSGVQNKIILPENFTFQMQVWTSDPNTGVFTIEFEDFITKIWTGTEWQVGGVTDVAPTLAETAILEGDYNTTTHGNINAFALQVDAALTVEGDTFININGDITINPTGSLAVAHTGSVVQVQETATVTNNGAISVLVETPNLDVLDFMIMGSPMTVETREDVWGTASVVNKHTTTDFTTYENPLNPVSGYNFYDSDVNDWSATSGILSPGEGYLVRPQAQVAGTGGVFNYDFNTGSLNTGPLTYALDYNSDPGGPESSPSVLSNPYPSGIQIQLFLDANPQIDAVYLWEHNTSPAIDIPSPYVNKYSMEDVSVVNNTGFLPAPTGAVDPNGVLSTSQGFGVFASAAGTATFNNAMRLTTGNTTLRNNTISKDRLWLNVSSTVYNVSGNTLLGFVADATQGVDSKYDNGRVASKVSLYSHIQGSDRGYSIQAREAFEDSMTIALGFSSIVEEVTSYKISLSDFDGEAWLEATPYLVDNQTGVITNLMEDSYNFTSDMGEFNDRFEIIFQDRSLGSQQSLASSIAMYPNPASDVVTIASPTAAITMVEVRDIRGRLILNKAVTSQNVTTINVASLDSALYLVTITTDSGSITSRLIIE